jgi:NADH:ubiquinone oxidoreductase subunit 3 (subunit A)
MTAGPIAAAVFVLLSAVISIAVIAGAALLRVKAKTSSPLKERPYECGEEPLGPTWIAFHPRYYVVALVFVIFDVEAAFLLPWALIVRALGTAGLVSVFTFVGILLLGWIYAIKKGALKWQ